MRKAGLVVGQTLELMRAAIAPGITTNDLNNIAIKNLAANGAKSNFLNYHGFPAVIYVPQSMMKLSMESQMIARLKMAI